MRSTTDHDEHKTRKLPVLVAALMVILALAVGAATMALLYPPAPNNGEATSVTLTYEQYANEAMGCNAEDIQAMGDKQVEQVVDNYRAAIRMPMTEQLAVTRETTVTDRYSINSKPDQGTRLRHYRIVIGFDAVHCGFEVHAFETPHLYGASPKHVPHSDAHDKIVSWKRNGQKLDLPSTRICYSRTIPSVTKDEDHNVANVFCDEEDWFAQG